MADEVVPSGVCIPKLFGQSPPIFRPVSLGSPLGCPKTRRQGSLRAEVPAESLTDCRHLLTYPATRFAVDRPDMTRLPSEVVVGV
jgi:hypothetical protein